MAKQFRNLIFEGGGVKGIAYIGAIQALSLRGHLSEIERVGGTSAGAINALIFALGYDIHEQRGIMESLDFRDFMDSSFGFIRDFRRLWNEFGWHKGDFCREWVGELVQRKLGNKKATFKDLKQTGNPDLYVIGTNISSGYSETFSYERQPEMELREAIRISMSIPLFYRAKRYGPNNEVYVDGGVMLNYPVKLFDRERYIEMSTDSEAARKVDYYNRENAQFLLHAPDRSPYVYNRQTIGLRLDKQEEIALYRYGEKQKAKEIKRFPQYAKALIEAIMQVQENKHLHSDDWQRTIYINTLDVSVTDFNLSDQKKKDLVEEGIKGVENYFKWFDNPQENPVNRIK